jgi:hypothetical protein
VWVVVGDGVTVAAGKGDGVLVGDGLGVWVGEGEAVGVSETLATTGKFSISVVGVGVGLRLDAERTSASHKMRSAKNQPCRLINDFARMRPIFASDGVFVKLGYGSMERAQRNPTRGSEGTWDELRAEQRLRSCTQAALA